MIVITAPTSNIGHQVVDNLLGAGEAIRVIARDPARLAREVRERVEVVVGTHADAAVVDEAFAGADSVFWLVPSDPHATSAEASYVDFSRPACAALKSRGVKRVVAISALGRGTPVAGSAGHVTASLAMCDLIAGTGVDFRALALPGFMDNMLRQVSSIRDQGVFYWPQDGNRKNPTCATRDIAAAATKLLLDRSWSGSGEVAVLGPDDLSLNDMAEIMTAVLGKPVHFERTPDDVFKTQLTGFGMSEPMAQAMLDMMIAKNHGLDNGVPRTPDSSSPTSFRQWCEDTLKPAVLG
jgi:uncharacterized protein YbjT (DUF2867 family)